MISTTYKYNVSILLTINDETLTINTEALQSFMIDSNYDINNRPIIYINLGLQPAIYDKMVLNQDNGAMINFRVEKYREGSTSVRKTYIHDNFSYLIKSDPDYLGALKKELNSTNNTETQTEYMYGTIALFKKSTLENMKTLYNDIIKNSTMESIIHKYTKDRKMVMHPLISKNIIDTIIIPPMESLTELISFLNDFDAFYDERYRYFEDFDITYLLNSTGEPINSVDQYNTVIIDVLDTTDDRTKSPGIVIDSDNNAYILYISGEDTKITIDQTKNIEYSSIMGISSSGEIYRVELDNYNGEDNNKKVLIQRIYNDNMRYINNLKHEMDSSSVMLQITRSELDNSIITPNKEYLVNAYTGLEKYNGKYVLSFKKEVFIKQTMEFVSDTIIGLRKVME